MARVELLNRRTTQDLPEKNTSDFRLEYRKNVPDQVLIDDVVSYLGEYRFSLPKFSYELKFSNGKLRDPHRLDSMEELSQRAIDASMSKGKFSTREQAEKTAFQKLDQDLKVAKHGDTIVWISPPGPKEDGYGDYGFVFFGKVEGNGALEKKIKMTAIRIENPTIEQSGNVIQILSGNRPSYKTAEGFLANPLVLTENLSEEYVDSVLGTVFSFKANPQEQKNFNKIIAKMFPLIAEFVHSAKDPWKKQSEKIKELYSLENYALRLKREYKQSLIKGENIVVDFKPNIGLMDIRGEYGHEPPKVAGSCPSSNKSSNILSRNSFINSLLGNSLSEDQEWFHCPKCSYKADGPIGNQCPGCGLTKEAYAEESGVSCD
jgi:hypothetical protein